MSVSLIRPMGNSTVLQVSHTEYVNSLGLEVAQTQCKESMKTEWVSYQIYRINSGSVLVHLLHILVNSLETVKLYASTG